MQLSRQGPITGGHDLMGCGMRCSAETRGFYVHPAQVGPNALSRNFRNDSVQALVLIHLVMYHTPQ